MSNVTLATGPVTWGVDFADTPANPPWSKVLDEIASSALDALELGPIGYLPEDPGVLSQELSNRKLTPVGSFLFDDLHDPARARELDAVAKHAGEVIAGAGGRVFVIIDRPGAERAATAGRSRVARRLDRSEWNAMLDVIRRLAEIARQRGLTPVVHPHVGSYIEFQDEIERLLEDSDLPICLDTGHAAYARISPETALVDYGSRLAHLHLKDIDGNVLSRVHAEELSFWDAIAAGVFTPLGNGVVDLAAVATALRRIDYNGYATIEQDRVPGSGTPLDDLRQCLQALHHAGIGDDPARDRLEARR